jgi:hypothetical protein
MEQNEEVQTRKSDEDIKNEVTIAKKLDNGSWTKEQAPVAEKLVPGPVVLSESA